MGLGLCLWRGRRWVHTDWRRSVCLLVDLQTPNGAYFNQSAHFNGTSDNFKIPQQCETFQIKVTSEWRIPRTIILLLKNLLFQSLDFSLWSLRNLLPPYQKCSRLTHHFFKAEREMSDEEIFSTIFMTYWTK